jgi:hypothetical protein
MAYSIAFDIVIVVFVLSWIKGVTIDWLCQGERKLRRLLRISKQKKVFFLKNNIAKWQKFTTKTTLIKSLG